MSRAEATESTESTVATTAESDTQLMLQVEGRTWPLLHGSIIGRQGTVGGAALRKYDVLSRQHLHVESEPESGRWHVTLMPKVGNETFCNGEIMVEGQPVIVHDTCEIHVVSLTMRITVVRASAKGREHPTALVTLDKHLRVEWHNDTATRLLGQALAPGVDFLQLLEKSIALRLRYALLALKEGAEMREVDAGMSASDGAAWIALRAVRSEGKLLLSLREATRDRQQREAVKQAAGKLDIKVRTLTTLLTAKPFVDGDLASALPLLVRDAAELLDATEVSAWLPAIRSPHATETTLTYTRRAIAGVEVAAVGKEARLKKIPERGEVLPSALSTLRSAGLLGEEAASAWLEPLDEHALLVFQRNDITRAWEDSEMRLAGLTAALGRQLFANVQRREAMEELQKREAISSSELGDAAQYVESRFPQVISEGSALVDWVYEPCERLGGDTFGYEWLDEQHFVIYVADVMGHGSKAALHGLSLSQTMKLFLARRTDVDPATWLSALNNAFPMSANLDLLWTMWCGVFDTSTRILRHACGGHPPGLLCHEGKFQSLTAGGPVLGAIEDVEYTSETTEVPEGAKLFLFSDGAYEFPLANGSTGTFEDFSAAVDGAARMDSGECAYLKIRAAGLCADSKFPDDFTIVRVQFCG
jgi:serine phosphatase RsbU (regulator of sigma subunit)